MFVRLFHVIPRNSCISPIPIPNIPMICPQDGAPVNHKYIYHKHINASEMLSLAISGT